jgi:hypothetical protein
VQSTTDGAKCYQCENYWHFRCSQVLCTGNGVLCAGHLGATHDNVNGSTDYHQNTHVDMEDDSSFFGGLVGDHPTSSAPTRSELNLLEIAMSNYVFFLLEFSFLNSDSFFKKKFGKLSATSMHNHGTRQWFTQFNGSCAQIYIYIYILFHSIVFLLFFFMFVFVIWLMILFHAAIADIVPSASNDTSLHGSDTQTLQTAQSSGLLKYSLL